MSKGQNMRDHHPGIRCHCLDCFHAFRTGGDSPTEADLAARDARACGIGILRGGVRVDPADFYIKPEES